VRRIHAFVVCALVSVAVTVRGQALSIKPIQIASGTVITFHLQTRLRASASDPLNNLPSGTLLQVKMLDTMQRTADADGVPFRGSVVSPLVVNGQVIIHPDAVVQGLQILLRNRNHPEGFRYELLITGLVDQGQSYTITASFDPPFTEANGAPLPGANVRTTESADGGAIPDAKSSQAGAN
jgi:hypothetical protein